MAHPTFFSWHHEQDLFRSSVVCSSPQLEDFHKTWIPAKLWRKTRVAGDSAVGSLVLNELKHTRVTAVLIGPEIANHAWTQYEIDSSLKRGNGLLGIHIHNIEDEHGRTAPPGTSPLPPGYPTYDWVLDEGFKNLHAWVDAAHYAP